MQRLQRRALAMRSLMLKYALGLVACVMMFLLGLALFSPIFDVSSMRVERSDPRVDIERVQFALEPLFGEHLFFLSAQEVRDLLEDALPDVAEISMTKEYPSTLVVRISLDPLIAKLSIDIPDQSAQVAGSGAQTGTGDLAPIIPTEDFLTSRGIFVAYPSAQVLSGSGLLQLRVVDWGARPEVGKQLVEPAFLDAIRSAEEELRVQFGQVVRSRTVYVRAREFHLQLPTIALWFDLRSPLTEQLQRYRFFLQSVGAQSAKEYVDLRLKDKIVYK